MSPPIRQSSAGSRVSQEGSTTRSMVAGSRSAPLCPSPCVRSSAAPRNQRPRAPSPCAIGATLSSSSCTTSTGMRTCGAAAATEISLRGAAELRREARAQVGDARAASGPASSRTTRGCSPCREGTPNRQILLGWILGGFRQHGEHGAAAERMADHRVHRFVRAQHLREAVAKSRQVGVLPGECAMRGRVDADHRESRRAQRRDEIAEARARDCPSRAAARPRGRRRPISTT